VAVFLFSIACTGSLRAQGYGSITGTVTDPTGAIVPSAQVKAIQLETGRATTVATSSTGQFVFPALAPSGYSLSVEAGGFQKYEQTGILLEANQAVTVNPKLSVGAATTTVEVTSAAPLVDTTTGTLSQVIGQQSVVDLPLNGRNAAALVTLVAGVVIAPH
jgi:hypothetical protein